MKFPRHRTSSYQGVASPTRRTWSWPRSAPHPQPASAESDNGQRPENTRVGGRWSINAEERSIDGGAVTYSVAAESSRDATALPMGLTGVYRTSGGPVQDLEAMHRLHGSTDSEVIVDGPLGVAWSSGAQVQRAQVRTLSCTFDGYLYQRDKLARELGLDAASDAELVVRGYERYGEKLLTSLRGRFTLALWDGASQRGLLCSDLLSSRPLFLWRGVGYLAFAGELRDLLSLLPSRPGPDSVGFLSWLGGWNIPIDRTLYEGISRLSPGHLVELGGDGRTWPYWQPRYAGT